jgi:hypothetical protein
MEKPKKTKREYGGRKPSYSEPTTTFACRVPESKKEELTAVVKRILERWKSE